MNADSTHSDARSTSASRKILTIYARARARLRSTHVGLSSTERQGVVA